MHLHTLTYTYMSLHMFTCTYMHLHSLTCTLCFKRGCFFFLKEGVFLFLVLHALACTYMHLHTLTCTYKHLHVITCTYMYESRRKNLGGRKKSGRIREEENIHTLTCTYMHLHVYTCTYMTCFNSNATWRPIICRQGLKRNSNEIGTRFFSTSGLLKASVELHITSNPNSVVQIKRNAPKSRPNLK